MGFGKHGGMYPPLKHHAELHRCIRVSGPSRVAQLVKYPPAMQENPSSIPGSGSPLEKG